MKEGLYADQPFWKIFKLIVGGVGLDAGRLIREYIRYSWTSLYARDRDSKNRLEYNEFEYKKTKDDCKLEDRFQKKGHFRIAYTQNRR